MYGFIDQYNELRATISKMIQLNPKLLGEDEWLRHVIQESEMTLSDNADTIGVRGSTYTMQTMCHEWFEFQIPKSDIEVFQIQQLLKPGTS